jgi:hypothetical protein
MAMAGLTDLAQSLQTAKLGGVVTHLAIVAHGDAPGQVVLDGKLTALSIADFQQALRRLRDFLTPSGMLTFYSCIAGRGPEGSSLLCEVSKWLPGRTVVGFELYGLIGPPGIPNAPGNMMATESSNAQVAMNPEAQHGRLSPWCPFAKRAKDGQIVHYPMLEQAGRPGNRCANPQCPGHSAPSHSCPSW